MGTYMRVCMYACIFCVHVGMYAGHDLFRKGLQTQHAKLIIAVSLGNVAKTVHEFHCRGRRRSVPL